MKKIILGFTSGSIITVVFALIMMKVNVLASLKVINSDYASVLSFIVSIFLAIITTVYVVFTYFQVSASNRAVEISKSMIEQNEKTMKMSNIPVIELKVNSITGSKYYRNRRRQMRIDVEVVNIGEGPALQVHSKAYFQYKHIENIDRPEFKELSYLGTIPKNEKKDSYYTFETKKVERFMEDCSICYVKNTHRVNNNPSKRAYERPDIVLEVVYQNIYGEFFMSTFTQQTIDVKREILEEKSDEMSGENETNNAKERKYESIYMHGDGALSDTDRFKVTLINDIYSKFFFKKLSKEEAEEFIRNYNQIVDRVL